MRLRTKYLIKNWAVKALWLMFGGFVIWANIAKLRNNDYSNYEKVIDYGRIKDEDKLIRPSFVLDGEYKIIDIVNGSARIEKDNLIFNSNIEAYSCVCIRIGKK